MLSKKTNLNTSINKESSSVRGLEVGKVCMAAINDVMPPAFCWKSGGDVGTIPTGCPDGFFRFLALCYENCKPGYDFILGVCYKK